MSIALFVGSEFSEMTLLRRSGRWAFSMVRGVGTVWLDERNPSVDGIVIVPGSSVVSMYIVIARGGGAMRSFLACGV